jgi:hypothetical protein
VRQAFAGHDPEVWNFACLPAPLSAMKISDTDDVIGEVGTVDGPKALKDGFLACRSRLFQATGVASVRCGRRRHPHKHEVAALVPDLLQRPVLRLLVGIGGDLVQDVAIEQLAGRKGLLVHLLEAR